MLAGVQADVFLTARLLGHARKPFRIVSFVPEMRQYVEIEAALFVTLGNLLITQFKGFLFPSPPLKEMTKKRSAFVYTNHTGFSHDIITLENVSLTLDNPPDSDQLSVSISAQN